MKRLIVLLLFAALGGGSALLLGYGLSLGNWFLAAAAGFLFLIVFLLQTITFSELSVLVPLTILEMAANVLFFFWGKGFSWWMAAAFAGSLFFALSAAVSGRREIDNLIRFRFFHVGHSVLPRLFLGLSIFVSLAGVNYLNERGLTVSPELFQYYVGQSQTILGKVMPNFTAPPPALLELMRHNINSVLVRMTPAAKTALLGGIALFSVLSLAGLSFFVEGLTGVAAWLIFQLLLAGGLLKINVEERIVERVGL